MPPTVSVGPPHSEIAETLTLRRTRNTGDPPWTSARSTSTGSPASPPARAASAVADPPANAEMVLRGARECAEEGVVVALFPEMTLTGYSLEDLVLQDAVLDDVERALATVVEGTADLLPLIVFGAPLRHRNRIYNCAVVVHRGAILGVVPKSYPPTYREFYEGRQLASGRRRARRDPRRRRRRAVRHRPAVRRRATCPASSSTPRCARTCGSRSRRAPRRRWRARPCCSTCPAARSPSAGRRTASCCAARRPRAAWPRTSTPPPARASRSTDLAWDGQTTIYENGVLLAETERFKDGDRRAVADVDLDLLLQERRRMGTFDDNRRAHPTADFRTRRLHARSARRRPRAAAHASSATRSSPPTSSASTSTATRPTTSRSPGCSSGCARSATRRS